MFNIALFFTLISVSLYAENYSQSIRIFEPDIRYVNNVTFHVNKALNRAWIEYTYYDTQSYLSEGEPGIEGRDKINGLRFDSDTNAIVFDRSNGSSTTCVQYVQKGRGIFRRTIAKNSRQCSFEMKTHKASQDDGYNIQETERIELTFVLKD